MAQESEAECVNVKVDEYDDEQDWQVHGQEANINESEDQFVL